MKKVKKIAIFDIDGTIFRKNLHFELIAQLTWMKIFPQEVRTKLVDLYTDWLEHEGTYESYRNELIKLYADNIKGHTKEEVEEASRKVVAFHEKRTYIYTEKLIAKLKKEGYHIIAVSGSPSEIVDEYNKGHLQLDESFGTVYEIDGSGKYTGRATFEPAENKGGVVKQYVFENDLSMQDSYGVGDTESDESFLRLVENSIAFNPNKNLHAIAQKQGWKIVVEKKDVIYEI